MLKECATIKCNVYGVFYIRKRQLDITRTLLASELINNAR